MLSFIATTSISWKYSNPCHNQSKNIHHSHLRSRPGSHHRRLYQPCQPLHHSTLVTVAAGSTENDNFNANDRCDSDSHILDQEYPSNLPPRLKALCEHLRAAPDARARALRLAALANSLSILPQSQRTAHTRVSGCTSQTHLHVAVATDPYEQRRTVSLRGWSDAKLSTGVLALLAVGLHGESAAQVQTLSADAVLHASGLTDAGARVGGVRAVVRALNQQLSMRATIASLATTSAVTDTTSTTRKQREEPEREEDQEAYDGVGGDVAVLLSGGVDSSVALRLAMNSEMRVEAFYLKIWLEDEVAHLGECPWEEDIRQARAVCEQAGVQLHEVSLQREYWKRVVGYAVDEARRGRTPNPDVMCNSRVKFGAFFDYLGGRFERVVSGHYARVVRSPLNDNKDSHTNATARLCLSADAVKDQTYFLARLRQEQVAKAWFPVGDYSKTQVRAMADELNLPNRNRPDSQGICFLGRIRFEEFLRTQLGEEEGTLVEFESGKEVGRHRGFWFFTIGQRRGVGLSGGPWYVVAKDVERNIVFVSRQYNSEEKERRELEFEQAVWVSGEWPTGLERVGMTRRLGVKVRHGPKMLSGAVTRRGPEAGHVTLDERDKGIASGQVVALYDDETCLGSGIICSAVELQDAPKKVLAPSRGEKKLQASIPWKEK